jgi:hypothetical protein
MAVHAPEMGLMKTHVLERHLKCIDIFKPSPEMKLSSHPYVDGAGVSIL